MQPEYISECNKIIGNCKYTAETHHIISLRNQTTAKWLQLGPAIIAAISSTLSVGHVIPTWGQSFTAIAAVATAITTVLNPSKHYHDHLSAAKAFTMLKQDADSLLNTFGPMMDQKTLATSVQMLHNRYNDLIKVAPPTDEKAFKKAQSRIQLGVHEPD